MSKSNESKPVYPWQVASEEWMKKRTAEHQAAMQADIDRQKRHISHVSSDYLSRKYKLASR